MLRHTLRSALCRLTPTTAILIPLLSSGAQIHAGAPPTPTPPPPTHLLKWFTIDGGFPGIAKDSNEDYLLFGSFGQPDVGWLASQNYLLRGGFLHPDADDTFSEFDIEIIEYPYSHPLYDDDDRITREELVDGSFYLRQTNPKFRIQGLNGMIVTIEGRLNGDDPGNWLPLGSGTVSGKYATIPLATGANKALPEEAIIDLRVTWQWVFLGYAQRVIEGVKVDVLPPRNVYPIAPSGDFFGVVPPPDYLVKVDNPYGQSFAKGERLGEFFQPWGPLSDGISFYATAAVDFWPVEYSIELRLNETIVYPVGIEPNYTSEVAPVETLYLADAGTTPKHVLTRGAFPTNIQGWDPAGNLMPPGTGEYLWTLIARDLAGNETRIDNELWVPRLNESLWGAHYTDEKMRFRVLSWLTSDYGVEALKSGQTVLNYNGEWNPYTDATGFPPPTPTTPPTPTPQPTYTVPSSIKESYSPVIFSSTSNNPHERNQKYAEFVWDLSRRWQYWLDCRAADTEMQAKNPVGSMYAQHYPPMLAKNERLRASYELMAGRWLRMDILRDPWVTEKILYNQPEAIESNETTLTMETQFREVRGRFADMVGDRTLLSGYNRILGCQIWSGFVGTWYSMSAMKVQNAVADENNTVDSFANVIWLSDHNGNIIQNSMLPGGQADNASGEEYSGTSLGRIYQSPDPLEAYHERNLPESTSLFDLVGQDSFGQRMLQKAANSNRTAVLDSNQHQRLVAGRERAYPLVEHKVVENGEELFSGSVGRRGFYLGTLTDDFNFQGHKSVRTLAHSAGVNLGQTSHEFLHSTWIGHGMNTLRGPDRDNPVMRHENGFNRSISFLGQLGLDPLRSTGSFTNPLLGLPESYLTLLLGDYNSFTDPPEFRPNPQYGMDARVWDQPGHIAIAAHHGVFQLSEDRYQGTPGSDPTLTWIAWPRNRAYFLVQSDAVDGVYINRFPHVFQSVRPGDSRILSSVVLLMNSSTPEEGYKAEEELNPLMLADAVNEGGVLPSGSHLFLHRASDFGYADDPRDFELQFSGHHKLGQKLLFDFSRVVGLVPRALDGSGVESPNIVYSDYWGGNQGHYVVYDMDAARNTPFDSLGDELLYREKFLFHTAYIAPYDPSADTTVFVVPEGWDAMKGTFVNPYNGIENAIIEEKKKPTPDQNSRAESEWTRRSCTLVLLPGHHEISSSLDLGSGTISHWRFFGGGADPSEVTLEMTDLDEPIFNLTSINIRDFSLSNMTIMPKRGAVVDCAASYEEVAICNVVIDGFLENGLPTTEHAINLGIVPGGRVYIENNTIVNCKKGVTISSIGSAATFYRGGKRKFRNSALENNLIVGCTDYAIKIGSGSTAAAWNPFDDAFGDNSGGNPIIPVRNNMVWNCGWNPTGGMGGTGAQDDAYAFQGDLWYQSVSSPAPTEHYGIIVDADATTPILVRTFAGATEGIEWVADPLFLSTDPQSPNYLRLSNASPARNKGNPYRIDVWPGDESAANPRIARRSIGAFPSGNLGDDYEYLLP